MNRQARVVGTSVVNGVEKDLPDVNWQDFGAVNFFDAVRDLALMVSDRRNQVDVVRIEVRDEHDSSIPPAVFNVEVVREARILNPRRDTDKVEPKAVLKQIWDLLTGATK